MKTTLEIPDALFRRAKARAAERGIPFRQLVTEAVSDELESKTCVGEKPWMRHAGGLKRLKKETARINRIIEAEFETIQPEDRL